MTTKKTSKRPARADLKALYDTQVKDNTGSWKREYDTTDDHAFLMWAFDLILSENGVELTHDQVNDACERDKHGDLKIDGSYIDQENARIFLVQSKNWDPTKLIGDDPFFVTWEAIEILSDPKRVQKANRAAQEFYSEFVAGIQANYSVFLAVATSGRISADNFSYVKARPNTRAIIIGNKDYSVQIQFEVFGLQRLIDIWQGDDIANDSPKTIKATVSCHEGFYIVKGEEGGQYRSLYATIPAAELVNLRARFKAALYKLNLRGPLGRIMVNKEMSISINSKDLSHIFHVLNNGVTAICDHFTEDTKANNVEIEGLQIVNGCQTTETLFQNSTKVLGHPELKVNLRLIQCLPSQAGLIAKATNQQTRLRAEDFVALEKIHETLQKQFDVMTPPWYYEIKPRWWSNVIDKSRVGKKYKDGSTKRVIARRDAAQRSFAFLGEPIKAVQKTADIFVSKGDEESKDKESKDVFRGYKEDVFPTNLSAYQLLLPWVLYERIKECLTAYLAEVEDEAGRKTAKVWLEYGRLTALGLVGDALRESYGVAKLKYLPSDLSRKLVGVVTKGEADDIINLALNLIWQQASSQSQWKDLGARATFRRAATYEATLAPSFLASWRTMRRTLASSLPRV